MRARSTFAFAAALTLALLPGVRAQQNPQPPDAKQKAQGVQPLNPFGSGSPLGQFAPLMMGFGSIFGGTVDPTHSNAMNLLQRNDVRSELLLSAQQREKLDDLKTNAQMDLIGRIIGSVSDFQGIQDAPQDQQLEQAKQGLSKLQDTLQTYQNDQDKEIAKLLNLKATGGVTQVERLRQLDLQWRGPLALSEKKLAEELKLTPDQRTKASETLGDYMQAQGEAMMKAFQDVGKGVQENAQPGANPPGAGFQFGGGFNPAEMQKKMQDAMQSDAVKKARKAAEKKVLETLTPEQKETWN